jgi:hypothetical protein
MMTLSTWQDQQCFILNGGWVIGKVIPHRDQVLCHGIFRLQNSPGFEYVERVIVTARSKKPTVGTPGQSTDLLCMKINTGEHGHATRPCEDVHVDLIRPLHRVQVDMSSFIADKQIFNLHPDLQTLGRSFAEGSRTEAYARDRGAMGMIESWAHLRWRP